jgi:hypothetical protein
MIYNAREQRAQVHLVYGVTVLRKSDFDCLS